MGENPQLERAHRIESQRVWSRLMGALAKGGADGAAMECQTIAEKHGVQVPGGGNQAHAAATAEARSMLNDVKLGDCQVIEKHSGKVFAGWSPPCTNS